MNQSVDLAVLAQKRRDRALQRFDEHPGYVEMSNAMRFDEAKFLSAVEAALDPEKPGSTHPMLPVRH